MRSTGQNLSDIYNVGHHAHIGDSQGLQSLHCYYAAVHDSPDSTTRRDSAVMQHHQNASKSSI
jgi:hypothetical protein